MVDPLIINRNEIRVLGMQRSGNHAIINWLINQAKNRICFINGAFPGANPFIHNWGIEYINIPYCKEKDAQKKFIKKDWLIMSYEDHSLENIFKEDFINYNKKFVGESKAITNILILRDPYNLIASRIKGRFSYNPSFIKVWKNHAKEFLGLVNNVPEPKIFINFNKWFRDAKYREKILKNFNLTNINEDVSKVSPNGNGSSFDGLKKNGRAFEMDLLNRWKYYKDNKEFIEIFQDSEICELSEKIFGKIEGTDKLYIQ